MGERKAGEHPLVLVNEIDSMIRLVQSQLDASVIRFLREGDD